MKYNNINVRRQDRLLDEKEALNLLKNGEYGILSIAETSNGIPQGYGIPFNYVWDSENNIYFHCAPDGRKLDALKQNPNVTFTIVGATEVISNKFTTNFQSIIISGTIKVVECKDERMNALAIFLDKYSPKDKEIGMKYAEGSFARTTILRFTIENISGKSKHITPKQ